MRRPVFLMLLFALPVAPLLADEGMWTFHGFPADRVKQKYGVAVSPEWLDRIRTATIRLSGCTASFVSPDGLILTNHHCVTACLAQHSSAEQDLLENGFLAPGREQELRCGTQIADVLVEVEDVTATIESATRGLSASAASEARRRTLIQLVEDCEARSARSATGALECESVVLYQGGQYFLYKYERYGDVRLVFAPEEDIAAFGGDPDNFQFPRWCFDVALLRAYDASGRPAATPHHLPIDFAGPDEGELVFVAGHPASTDRLLTTAQLTTLRDIDLPQWLLRSAELRGRYLQFARTGPEAARIVAEPLFGLENSIKVRRKQLDALHDDALLQEKANAEAVLRKRFAGTANAGGDPWEQIGKAQQAARSLWLPYTFLEGSAGFNSRLFRYARTIVRGAEERAKPNTARLREYADASMDRVEQQLSTRVPIYPELEILTLSFSLERMREWLGPDHSAVREVLGRQAPESLATRLVEGSRLADPAVRLQLWKGGMKAVEVSDDPMIRLARAVDDEARAVRGRYEREVDAPVEAASERIADARFEAYGTSSYPDATFTLRLSYGTVRGWVEHGERIEPFTRLQRAFDRATGEEPFRIPDRWQRTRNRLDMSTRFNLATDNDIVGGNSGSPLVDAQGRIVGLIFDGNIHSISGSYWFDTEKNRAVAVHPAIMREALSKVYDAGALLAELGAR